MVLISFRYNYLLLSFLFLITYYYHYILDHKLQYKIYEQLKFHIGIHNTKSSSYMIIN